MHEDDRRILEDFPEGKILTVKKDCILGSHYHKIKTEKFILIKGKAILEIYYSTEPMSDALTSSVSFYDMEIGKIYTVNPYDFHKIRATKDSVIVGLSTTPFNQRDYY